MENTFVIWIYGIEYIEPETKWGDFSSNLFSFHAIASLLRVD